MRRVGWIILGCGLVATLFAAASFDRRSWPMFEGDEATYLMQAESLAWDLDVRYERADFERFVAHWGRRPEGLILQSTDGGATLTYGKPVIYSLAIAPFVRFSPTRGASVANALAMALAGLAAAAALSRWIGTAAPWWVAAYLFGSVAFAYVPWAHADLFLMCLVALALSICLRSPTPLPFSWRECLACGMLLGLVAASRPFYAALMIPAAFALLRGEATDTASRAGSRRWRGAMLLVAGGFAAVLAMGSFDLAFRGTATSYAGERLSFDSTTGFPGVERSTGTWRDDVARRGPANWLRPGGRLPYRFNARTWFWDTWYFLCGRTVGLIPYYPALLLALWAWRNDRTSWLLLLAFALVAAAFFATRPFNFFGGAGALANRYILPAYPALWFLARRPRHSLAIVPFALLAAIFLRPLWAAPWRFPLTAGGQYRWVSDAAERWLPYETTQSHIKPAGREDFLHGRLWIKPLSPALEPHLEAGAMSGVDRAAFLSLPAGAAVELVAGSPQPLRSLCLVPLPETASDGAGAMTLSARGGILPFYRVGADALRLEPAKPLLRHAMWWTEENFTLFRLRIASLEGEAPDAERVRFRLAADCEETP